MLSPVNNDAARAEAFEAWSAERAQTGYPRKADERVLRIYTTRPDTLFGATYMVIAPEHPFVARLTTAEQAGVVRAYCEQAARKSDLDRTDLAKDKTGVFTGTHAINPMNGKSVPIWVADYVLMGYGTGAIMAVPAHDTRDFEFARQFDLPIVPVVDPGERAEGVDREAVLAGCEPFIGEGAAMQSGAYDGLPTREFKQKITAAMAAKGFGREAVNYKLRDWLFSRQHFWGEPFPILHELNAEGQPTGRVRAVDESELPVDVPEIAQYESHGSPEPPLERAPAEWLYPVIDGVKYKRETNSMPQWAGSCWYYLRFWIRKTKTNLSILKLEKAWMPVSLLRGRAEHAVLHLLCVLLAQGAVRPVVSTIEPFQKLVNQGMILGEMEITGYRRADGGWVSLSDVKTGAEGQLVEAQGGAAVSAVSALRTSTKTRRGFVLVEDLEFGSTAVRARCRKPRKRGQSR